MTSAPLYHIGQTVYHVSDEDPGVVLAVINYGTHLEYRVTWGGRCNEDHKEAELSPNRVFIGTSSRDDDKEDSK